jgi:hypothetical protein
MSDHRSEATAASEASASSSSAAAHAVTPEPETAKPETPELETPEPHPEPRPDPAPSGAASDRTVAFGLAGILVLVILLIVTAPFWAPTLPWGVAPPRDDTALNQHFATLETARQRSEQQLQQALQQQAAATGAALQPLERRIAALEAKPTIARSEIDDIRQQLANVTTATVDLTTRVEALDKTVRTRSASDTTDIASVLALLQIRGAVQTGRPFTAEYATLATLARGNPDIAAAIAPLAEPAKTGVASRAVLASRLHAMAGTIATAHAPAASAGWADRTLDQLSGLVTIRRTDGGGEDRGPDAAINGAERALAGNDLREAIAALSPLTGGPAEAAAPWLKMAQDRIAVEAALQRIEALLTARLGNRAVPAGSPG